MRLFLGLRHSLRAGAAHVRRRVWGAAARLRAEAGSPAAHVRLAAVHRERQAGEVGQRCGLTVADHPEERGGGVAVHR